MNTELVIAFVYLGFSLLMSLLIYVPYWRSGDPVPGSQHAGTVSSIGLFFLLMAVGMDVNGGMAMMLGVLSAILSIGSAVMVSRLRRQMKSRGR